MTLTKGVKPGDTVTAKRAGWDEELSSEEFMDMEPYADKGYATDGLSGILEVVESPTVTVYLVGGQEADPQTIRKRER